MFLGVRGGGNMPLGLMGGDRDRGTGRFTQLRPMNRLSNSGADDAELPEMRINPRAQGLYDPHDPRG